MFCSGVVMFLRVFALLCGLSGMASADVYKVYLDADRTSNYASARSIEIGILAAFDEVDRVVNGREIEFVPLDHRANSKRSKRHLQQFLDDPQAIAVVGGLHSPPYLSSKDYVNENGIPLLLPWSAAAPLTRAQTARNSIFRLSLDDAKAAKILVPQAVTQDKCQHITLILWRSGWGESNERTMTAEMKSLGFGRYNIRYFEGNLGEADALSLANALDAAGSDCAIYVGNAKDASVIFTALHKTDMKTRMLSHWGITGGDFEEDVPAAVRDGLQLRFIQPCFSFEPPAGSSGVRLKQIVKTYGEDFDESGYLRAPAGFFHGYDLGLLLIEALRNIEVEADIATQRAMLIKALTNIEGPIDGLLRRYEFPFSEYATQNPEAHEALEVGDFCMARFDNEDRIVTAKSDHF